MTSEEKQVSQKKRDVVTELKQKIEDSRILVAVDFRGTKVNDITAFSKTLFSIDCEMKVYKNTLSRRAFEELNVDFPADIFKGPTMIVSTKEDVVQLSKNIKTFMKETETFSLKGAYFNKSFVDSDTVDTLAMLPSREELIAKVIGGIKSPLTGLVQVLSGPTRGLVYVLENIKQQKQG